MKNIKSCLTAVTALFLLSGCLEVSGTFSNDYDVKLINNSTGAEELFYPGVYKTDVEIKDTKLIMRIDYSFINKNEFVFESHNKDITAIKSGEVITLKSGVSGQPYALRAKYVEKKSDLSGYVSKSIECTRPVERNLCQNDPFNDRCKKTVQGKRTVVYKETRKITTVYVDLIDKSNTVVGEFVGKKAEDEQEYDNNRYGECI